MLHATHTDVPLGVTALPTEDESMRHDDRPVSGAAGQIRPDPFHCGTQGRSMAPILDSPVGYRRGWFEKRYRVASDSRLLILKEYRRANRTRAHAHVDTGSLQQPGTDTQPSRRVMVAGDDDYLRLCLQHEPGLGLVPETDRVRRRHRPVVKVTGNEHGIDPFTTNDLDQMINECLVRIVQAETVQMATQMPVRGVKESHDR
ncbi:hypothetical protein GCM10011608_54160 [Micromonospora sonchi]|uniref:Uncharacterized protein n=1 Tax=Micromonospora sonchi TaxID=1763543 RepID=A0A917U751_9ACTN|nr:hypothetical protein GCM10011608_54160 [Micromonospora sonchi]